MNCTISGNTAGYDGGGINCDPCSSPIVTNCTITGNMAGDHGGGIYHYTHMSPAITNCILWGDRPDEVYIGGGGEPVITYSDVQGGWEGEGNIDGDPLFVMPNYDEYRLLWGSPCIDAGDPELKDPDGTRSNMGAHLFDQSKKLIVYLSPETSEIAPGETGRVRYTVCNSKPYDISFDTAAAIRLPNGAPWPGNPLVGPVFASIAPSSNLSCEFEYQVPLGWHPGTYSFAAAVGYGDQLFDRDRFKFTVIEPGVETK